MFQDVPRTYLGLKKILDHLRSLESWSNLHDREMLEILIAIYYLEVDSDKGLKYFESNDYLRSALSIKSLTLRSFFEWLGYANIDQHMNTLRSLISKHERFESTLAKMSADCPQNQLKDDLHQVLQSPGRLNAHCEHWFTERFNAPPLNQADSASIRLLIAICILYIAEDCLLPEFRLWQLRYICDDDLRELEEKGYVIKENFINESILHELSKVLQSLARTEASEQRAYLYGNDDKLQRVYNLIDKDTAFVSHFLNRKEIYEIAHSFFGVHSHHTPYYLSSFQANILYPGAKEQILHVDSSVPDPLPPWKIRLNVNLLLDPFTDINGATLIYPQSHTFLRKPTATDQSSQKLVKVIAPAGSIVVWSGHLWHRSGSNESSKSRAALLACFVASYLREIAVEENYLEVVNRQRLIQLPFEMRTILGFYHGRKDVKLY